MNRHSADCYCFVQRHGIQGKKSVDGLLVLAEEYLRNRAGHTDSRDCASEPAGSFDCVRPRTRSADACFSSLRVTKSQTGWRPRVMFQHDLPRAAAVVE